MNRDQLLHELWKTKTDVGAGLRDHVRDSASMEQVNRAEEAIKGLRDVDLSRANTVDSNAALTRGRKLSDNIAKQLQAAETEHHRVVGLLKEAEKNHGEFVEQIKAENLKPEGQRTGIKTLEENAAKLEREIAARKVQINGSVTPSGQKIDGTAGRVATLEARQGRVHTALGNHLNGDKKLKPQNSRTSSLNIKYGNGTGIDQETVVVRDEYGQRKPLLGADGNQVMKDGKPQFETKKVDRLRYTNAGPQKAKPSGVIEEYKNARSALGEVVDDGKLKVNTATHRVESSGISTVSSKLVDALPDSLNPLKGHNLADAPKAKAAQEKLLAELRAVSGNSHIADEVSKLQSAHGSFLGVAEMKDGQWVKKSGVTDEVFANSKKAFTEAQEALSKKLTASDAPEAFKKFGEALKENKKFTSKGLLTAGFTSGMFAEHGFGAIGKNFTEKTAEGKTRFGMIGARVVGTGAGLYFIQDAVRRGQVMDGQTGEMKDRSMLTRAAELAVGVGMTGISLLGGAAR